MTRWRGAAGVEHNGRMSDQTQVVRDLYAAFERRDVGAVLRAFDSDIEMFQTEVLPWGGTYRGTIGAASFFQRLAASCATAAC